jgi:hypothetical protein
VPLLRSFPIPSVWRVLHRCRSYGAPCGGATRTSPKTDHFDCKCPLRRGSGMVRAFSPSWVGARFLGRCPRLVWYGPLALKNPHSKRVGASIIVPSLRDFWGLRPHGVSGSKPICVHLRNLRIRLTCRPAGAPDVWWFAESINMPPRWGSRCVVVRRVY